MSLTNKALIQGTQQHPYVANIAGKTDKEIIIDIIKPFPCPKTEVIHASSGLSTPEWSCIVVDSVFRPSRTLITEPSGAVLLGIKVQHSLFLPATCPKHFYFALPLKMLDPTAIVSAMPSSTCGECRYCGCHIGMSDLSSKVTGEQVVKPTSVGPCDHNVSGNCERPLTTSG